LSPSSPHLAPKFKEAKGVGWGDVSAQSRFRVLRWQGQLKHEEFQRTSLEFRLE
jgi:hypothetical protein